MDEKLQQFYDKKVLKSLETKTKYEELSYQVVHKLIRKIHTIDTRFRANSLVKIGIPYDGVHGDDPIYFEMMLQLSLGESNSVFLQREQSSLYARIQPVAEGLWDDCIDKHNLHISPKKISRLFRQYLKRSVYSLKKHLDNKKKEKLPDGLTSIEIEDGQFNSTVIINKDMRVRILPAIAIPDCRSDLTRKHCPSSSHVVAVPKSSTSLDEIHKNHKVDKDFNKIAWKLSFFVAEKNKIRTVSDGCRMKLLRILTEIRDQDQRLRFISSYHLKTIFFYETDRLNGRRDWFDSKFSQRFLGLLRSVATHLQNETCPNYFMQPPDFPILNHFEDIPKEQLKKMKTAIEEIIAEPLKFFDKNINT